RRSRTTARPRPRSCLNLRVRGLKVRSSAKVFAKVDREKHQTLIREALACLQGKEYVEAGRLVQHLKDTLGDELLNAVKKPLGGKGWVKLALEVEPRIEQVDVPGKGEPCFRLARGRVPHRSSL
ncbi:unnamed protein product, partial [Prorocentrum cordatum]